MLWSRVAASVTTRMARARQKRVALIRQPSLEAWREESLRGSWSTRSMVLPRLVKLRFPAR